MVDVSDVIKINPEKRETFRALQKQLSRIQTMLNESPSVELKERLVREEQEVICLLQESKTAFSR